MQSTVINFTTEEKTKKEAQKLAKKMGLSLSLVLNSYLRQFIKTKAVVFSAEDEIPNTATRKALKESEADVKAGRVIRFDNPQGIFNYLDKKIGHAKKASQN